MTDSLSAAQRGRLAARLVPVAMELACLVQQDGDPEAIGELLSSLAAAERDALPVVLAGLVPVDRTPQELLAWIRWDEHGRALPPDAVMVLDTKRPQHGPERREAECGTPWGYERHRRLWEPICEPCRVAHADYRRVLREKRQQRESEAVA